MQQLFTFLATSMLNRKLLLSIFCLNQRLSTGTFGRRGYCEADLRLCFRIGKNPVFSRCGSYVKCWFSHDVAHILIHGMFVLFMNKHHDLLHTYIFAHVHFCANCMPTSRMDSVNLLILFV